MYNTKGSPTEVIGFLSVNIVQFSDFSEWILITLKYLLKLAII